MNYKLIMLPQPILVGRELSKEEAQTTPHFQDFDKRYFEIIANIECSPYLDLSLIAEEIGWVDVEKLAYKRLPIIPTFDKGEIINSDTNFFIRLGWMEGFKAAQSLNEKKYTLTDIENAFNSGRGYGNPNDIKDFNSFIQSLSIHKEYNVECIQEGNTIKVTKILR